MFKRRSKKKKDESELTGYSAPAGKSKEPPTKDNTQLAASTQKVSSSRRVKNCKPLEIRHLPKHSIENQDTPIQPTVDSRGAQVLLKSQNIGQEQPTIVESRNAGHEIFPKQPTSMESQDGKALPAKSVPIESQEAKKTSRSRLPLKAHSTVHQRGRGVVVSSSSFGMPDDLECDYEQETVEIEFETFSADEHCSLKYPSIVQRRHTDTVTSLRIDSSYDL